MTERASTSEVVAGRDGWRVARRPRAPLAAAIGWGAAWGTAYGFWLLGPEIVRRHHLELTEPAHWAIVLAAMVALFAALGAALALPVGVARRALGGRGSARLVVAIALPPAYLGLGVLIHAARFARLPDLGPYALALAQAAPSVALAGAALWCAGRRRSTPPHPRDGRNLVVVGLIVASLGGALQLPARFPPAAVTRRPAHALAAVPDAPPRRPLLVVGLDGGSWTALAPQLGTGSLPTFDALVRDGLHGEVEALWPPYWSMSAWAAIVTGQGREATAVWEDLVASVPGLPSFQAPLDLDARLVPVKAVEYLLIRAGWLRVEPPPRSALGRAPVWEWLDRSGVSAAVVRFNFTYPAPGQASAVISNRVVPDLWDRLGVRAADPTQVAAPAARRDELLTPFSEPSSADAAAIARVLPPGAAPRPRDVEIDPLELVRRVLPFDRRTFVAGAKLLAADPPPSVLMLHLEGFDSVCHAFWPYRFPELYRRRPPAAEIAALGPVVDRYLQFLDRGLGELIATFPEPPNVVVVSDHGFAALENGAPWRGWHASPGIFLAAGPDLPRRPETLRVSYFDVAPTILALQGLVPPAEMTGRAWANGGEGDRGRRRRRSGGPES